MSTAKVTKERKAHVRQPIFYMVSKGDKEVMTIASTEPEAIEKVHGIIAARRATPAEIESFVAKANHSG